MVNNKKITIKVAANRKGAGPKKKNTQAKRRNNNTRKQNQTSYTVPSAYNTKSQPRQETISTRIKGCDNLEIRGFTTNDNMPLGHTIMNGAITAKSSLRLAGLSSAYQRIKWHDMRFTIEGAFPTTAGGGYVACFVRDPTDLPPDDGKEAIRWAMAQQHSADAKWYDSVVLDVRSTPDLLYTSFGDGLRFSSPGTFWIISKGGPAQVGTITVNFHWDVTLTEPTAEEEQVKARTWVTPTDIYLPFQPDNGGAGPFLLKFLITVDPDPHSVTYSNYILPLTEYPTGTYLRLKEAKAVTGEYNTGNDYIPVYVSGFAVTSSGTLQAVYEVGGNYYLINGTTPDPAFGGFLASSWHRMSAGTGAFLEQGEELSVYTHPRDSLNASVNKTSNVNVFTAKGIRRLDGTDPYAFEVLPDIAQIQLAGKV